MNTEIRILLVDDEEFYLRLFSDILASRRFDVRTAHSGEEALVLLQQDHFDILITDLLMKKMDGLELTEQVRKHFGWVDIIVITQRDDVRLAVRSMRMGVFEYLVKPVDRDELLLTLDRLLERRRLLDQQNKLLDESMQYLQAQTVYRRCLDILSTLDFENLCEMILRHMLQATGAQGGVLWLTSPEERPGADGFERMNLTGYRGLVNLQDYPTSITISAGPALDALRTGAPFFANPTTVLGAVNRPGAGAEPLFIPLQAEGVPSGLLLLLDKLREDFTERDQNIARTMAQFSGIALKNSRRFQALERPGLRDQGSTAYNLTYFIDYAGKEIYKARRYGRSFSLVTVVIDRFEFLREHFKTEICTRMSRKLAESISRVVRDSDILARVSDHEYYLLLPETDSLGARMFVRRSQAAFLSDAFIAEMSRDYPISISMGAATFPIDGGDFDELLVACRDEMNRSRSSLFRRLRLEGRDLWETVRILAGRPDDHFGPLEQASEAFRIAEDAETGSAHTVLSEATLDAVEEEVCRQAVDAPERRALVFALGGSIAEQPRPVELVLEGAEHARAFLVGPKADSNRASNFASVTRVFVDDEQIERHRLLLVLGERLTYAFMGERGADGRLFGFHSSDQFLVESLIAKVQEHYHFQRQY
jgi:diguanylate cyclase (GGDEF)-like protein